MINIIILGRKENVPKLVKGDYKSPLIILHLVKDWILLYKSGKQHIIENLQTFFNNRFRVSGILETEIIFLYRYKKKTGKLYIRTLFDPW